ncbi:hypothetical protein ABIF78_007703 [Bradyrhizobium japonicum]
MTKMEMYRFETARFIVRAIIRNDCDMDTSWMDEETKANIACGLWQAFGTIVTVETKDGIKLGSDSLWGSVYENPAEFFSDHRSADPMNRNCSAMRAARGGNVRICHYFPDMIRQAVSDARKRLANMPKLKELSPA